MTPGNTTVSSHVSAEVRSALKERAKNEKRSVSYLIAEILEAAVLDVDKLDRVDQTIQRQHTGKTD